MSDLVKKCFSCGSEYPSTQTARCCDCASALYLFNKGQQKWVDLPSISVFMSPDVERSIPFIRNAIEMISIGQSESNIVVIDNPQVSGDHAVIICYASGCTIADCGSQTGTFLNGQRVIKQILKDGDKITIGDTVLQFVGPGDR